MLSLLFLAAAVAAGPPTRAADGTPLEFRADGVFDAIPNSMLMNVVHMTRGGPEGERPDWVVAEPEYRNTPYYASLPFGDDAQVVHFALDESDDEAVLYIDLNGNGDLTDDAPVAAERQTIPEAERTPILKMWIFDHFAAQVPVRYADGSEQTLSITFRTYGKVCRDLYDHMEPDIVYWSTYYREGSVRIGRTDFRVALKDQNADGRFDTLKDDDHVWGDKVYIDIDRNGTLDPRAEGFSLDAPFQIAGVTYEVDRVSPAGDRIVITPSDREVIPTTLRVGQVAPNFDIPGVGSLSSLRGEVVLVDFWATWCRPCMMEMPNVIRVHDQFREQGFRVVGVSLDGAGDGDKMRRVADETGMDWPQVHDTAGEVARQYFVRAIPAAFLIGPDGRIVAMHLRGTALDRAVERAVTERADSPPR